MDAEMQGQPQPPQQPPQGQPQGQDGHLEAIEQGILSQVQSPELEKLVLSGKQILYDPKTHEQSIENMRDLADDSDPRKVALGVAAILTILNRKANKIPVELMVPAGALLCVEVARFFQEAGRLELTPEFTGNMVEEFLAVVMQKMGFEPKQQQEQQPQQPNEIPGGVSPRQGLISQQQVPA